MNKLARKIQNTYLLLTFGNTLAASLIWGINTLFLLDAGLSNLEAFAANAFYTVGMVIFEIPTGVIADTWGRKTSYLLGTVTLSVSTIIYYLLWQIGGPFWQWAAASILLGLGFTFFSGAVEAWLVDALNFAKYKGPMEAVFGRAQIASGVAMLTGSVAGGVIAQATSLGTPYIVRGIILALMFIVAWRLMEDWGFTPAKGAHPLKAIRKVLDASLKHGLKNPPVRWIMLTSPFIYGVAIYVFFAFQPYLLNLYGNSQAYTIAGLAAAIFAASQVTGGILAPKIRRLFKKRTSALMADLAISMFLLAVLGLNGSFWLALILIVIWGLSYTAVTPIRQAYLNSLIPSSQRATVLSFDSLAGNSGGIVIQPLLGKAADVWSYGTSFLYGSAIQILALPFLIKASKEHVTEDESTNKLSGQKV
jgi:MFS family permease